MEPQFPAVSAATPPGEERRIFFLDAFDYGIHDPSALENGYRAPATQNASAVITFA
jgi:hypothetical protein